MDLSLLKVKVGLLTVKVVLLKVNKIDSFKQNKKEAKKNSLAPLAILPLFSTSHRWCEFKNLRHCPAKAYHIILSHRTVLTFVSLALFVLPDTVSTITYRRNAIAQNEMLQKVKFYTYKLGDITYFKNVRPPSPSWLRQAEGVAVTTYNCGGRGYPIRGREKMVIGPLGMLKVL